MHARVEEVEFLEVFEESSSVAWLRGSDAPAAVVECLRTCDDSVAAVAVPLRDLPETESS